MKKNVIVIFFFPILLILLYYTNFVQHKLVERYVFNKYGIHVKVDEEWFSGASWSTYYSVHLKNDPSFTFTVYDHGLFYQDLAGDSYLEKREISKAEEMMKPFNEEIKKLGFTDLQIESKGSVGKGTVAFEITCKTERNLDLEKKEDVKDLFALSQIINRSNVAFDSLYVKSGENRFLLTHLQKINSETDLQQNVKENNVEFFDKRKVKNCLPTDITQFYRFTGVDSNEMTLIFLTDRAFENTKEEGSLLKLMQIIQSCQTKANRIEVHYRGNEISLSINPQLQNVEGLRKRLWKENKDLMENLTFKKRISPLQKVGFTVDHYDADSGHLFIDVSADYQENEPKHLDILFQLVTLLKSEEIKLYDISITYKNGIVKLLNYLTVTSTTELNDHITFLPY